MITKRPATAINLAFALCIAIWAIALLWHYTITNAYTSPRVTLCEKQYIGYEYNPKYDKLCGDLFKKWTKQILSNK